MKYTPVELIDDRLERRRFYTKLESFLLIDKDYVDGSLVVSLEGAFGSGKSTVIRLWDIDLNQRDANNEDVHFSFIINAWETDYGADPLVSLVSALTKAIGEKDSRKFAAVKKSLRLAVNDIGWTSAALVSGFTGKFLGVDPVKAGQFAEGKHDKMDPATPDFVSIYEQKIGAIQDLKKGLRDFFKKHSKPVMIFIDELDRCRPDYAVRYLETIKHIFDVEGLIFVLAVDIGQLESTVKSLYGDSMDFDEYFRKFAHRRVTLPGPSLEGYSQLTRKYDELFLNTEYGRRTRIERTLLTEKIPELFAWLRLTPRQIQEAYRILGYSTAAESRDDQTQINWGWAIGVIFLSAIHVSDRSLFKRVISSEMPMEEMGEYFKGADPIQSPKWWFCVMVSGRKLVESDYYAFWTALTNLGWGNRHSENALHSAKSELRAFQDGWGESHTDQIAKVGMRIESAESLFN